MNKLSNYYKVNNCYSINHLQRAAHTLLILNPKDPKRKFEGVSLLQKMSQYGLVADDKLQLDSVLQLTTQKLLEQCLQTKVYR